MTVSNWQKNLLIVMSTRHQFCTCASLCQDILVIALFFQPFPPGLSGGCTENRKEPQELTVSWSGRKGVHDIIPGSGTAVLHCVIVCLRSYSRTNIFNIVAKTQGRGVCFLFCRWIPVSQRMTHDCHQLDICKITLPSFSALSVYPLVCHSLTAV